MSGSLITDIERNTILNRSGKQSPDYTPITQAQWGTGTTDPSLSDTDIETGAGSKTNISTTIDNTNDEVVITHTLDTGTGNGSTITEFATFNTDGTPRIGMRCAWGGTSKDNTKELRITAKNRMID